MIYIDTKTKLFLDVGPEHNSFNDCVESSTEIGV